MNEKKGMEEKIIDILLKHSMHLIISSLIISFATVTYYYFTPAKYKLKSIIQIAKIDSKPVINIRDLGLLIDQLNEVNIFNNDGTEIYKIFPIGDSNLISIEILSKSKDQSSVLLEKIVSYFNSHYAPEVENYKMKTTLIESRLHNIAKTINAVLTTKENIPISSSFVFADSISNNINLSINKLDLSLLNTNGFQIFLNGEATLFKPSLLLLLLQTNIAGLIFFTLFFVAFNISRQRK